MLVAEEGNSCVTGYENQPDDPAAIASTEAPLVLVVDDDTALRGAVTRALRTNGYRTASAEDGDTAVRKVRHERPDVVLLDWRLPDMTGLDVLRQLRTFAPEVPAIVWTGHGSVACAVDAIKNGALEYLQKPLPPRELIDAVERLLATRSPAAADATGILGESAVVRHVRALIRQVGPTHLSVLIQGESGTGKELAARAIHGASGRTGPFLALNCAAVTESLLESELYGYEPGAFTGAAAGGKPGLFAAAAGGTLFLDEIGEMALGLQAKLLRVLQERSYRPVGATEDLPVDCRIVASTNRDLADQVARGAFRADLYYRLNTHPIVMPPLRSRIEDVVRLAARFLEAATAALRKPLCGFDESAVRALEGHDWPGNVRELKNVVEHAAVLCPAGAVHASHLRLVARPEQPGAASRSLAFPSFRIRDVEAVLIRRALDEVDGNMSAAARLLGINRSTLYNKLRDHRIERG